MHSNSNKDVTYQEKALKSKSEGIDFQLPFYFHFKYICFDFSNRTIFGDIPNWKGQTIWDRGYNIISNKELLTFIAAILKQCTDYMAS